MLSRPAQCIGNSPGGVVETETGGTDGSGWGPGDDVTITEEGEEEREEREGGKRGREGKRWVYMCCMDTGNPKLMHSKLPVAEFR